MSLWAVSDSGGLVFGTPSTSRLEVLRFAPPFPGTSTVAPAIVPPPPMLDADASDREVAFRLVAAYRGAAEARTRKRCYMLGTGDVSRSRFFPILVNGGRALMEHRIPPNAWAAWSLDLWRKDDPKHLPPIGFVFGAKRIAQRRGWFRAEAATYLGGVAIYGPLHRALLSRWYSMAGELYRLTDPHGAAAIVERYFPGGSFDRQVAEARAEAARKAADLRADLERGVWLW